MRILLVRHGEPDYRTDSLTEKGRREAELLSRRLEHIPAKAYYVSPLGRARETAAFTLEKVGREAEVLPWLAEFRGVTVDPETGMRRIPWDYRKTTWFDHDLLLDRDRWTEDSLVAGGNVAEIWEETRQGVDALLLSHGYRRDGAVWRCDNNTEDTLILFCHFAIGTAILSCLTGIPPVPMWQSFLTLPTSITTLITQERGKGEIEFRCICMGDVSHLLEAGEPLSLIGLYQECWNGVDSTNPARWPKQPEKPALFK